MLACCAGAKDVLGDPLDTELLLEALPREQRVYHKEFADYSHLDFTWGMNAHRDVYSEVLNLLQTHGQAVS